MSLDHSKFANAVLYLLHECGDRPGLTKLVKLLYFADFAHYRKHLRPITGATYVAVQRGPVPDDYEKHFGILEQAGIIGRMEVAIEGLDKLKLEYFPKKAANEHALEDTEREVLDDVIRSCRYKTGVALSEASHLEGPWSWAWDPNRPGQPIPYVLARWLENRCDEQDMEQAREDLARPEVVEELKKLSAIASCRWCLS